jgi:alcohol dehydrogenase (cytochrome c)
MRMRQRVLLGMVWVVFLAGIVASGQGITSKDLLAGFANPAQWLTYSGDYTGRRHSPLKHITPANAARLAPQWTFQTNVLGKFEATPLVIDGVLYVTGWDNHVWALDARTGRQIWHYQRALPQGVQACCGRVNRGVAVHGTRLYMSTLDAHLVALEMKTGDVAYDVEIANFREGYASTPAPLVVKDKVIVGIAGGEYGIRGFIDAYDPITGKRVWRFYTVPATGEPGSDTWPEEVWKRGGGPTWLTGTYDPELNLLYWGTGNPAPDWYGDDRKGDNLYTGSVVALDADSGKLRWHFQFTPHDTHDWDANQIPVLADLMIAGRPRKVMLVANRNGFFYTLDRTSGEFLQAKPFVKTTWATEVDAKGRPRVVPGSEPTPAGTTTCPDLYGGTNFMSPAFDLSTGLFYVTARETCMVYASRKDEYKVGERWMGGSVKITGARSGALRAIDAVTGERKWEFPYPTPSWAGVLSTAGGVVFTGDNEGNFLVFDSRSGKNLYRYQIGAPVYAAPMTYVLDGKQYVALPAGTTLTVFGLASNGS